MYFFVDDDNRVLFLKSIRKKRLKQLDFQMIIHFNAWTFCNDVMMFENEENLQFAREHNAWKVVAEAEIWSE